ncbi:MAG: hypothetical protein EBQ80_02015 [Proteobacteria bacterium]|nr:hypothetical protein [Pseudomonadota bacterium]
MQALQAQAKERTAELAGLKEAIRIAQEKAREALNALEKYAEENRELLLAEAAEAGLPIPVPFPDGMDTAEYSDPAARSAFMFNVTFSHDPDVEGLPGEPEGTPEDLEAFYKAFPGERPEIEENDLGGGLA